MTPVIPRELSRTESLRGFGPLGILALLLIFIAGNFTVGNMVVFPAGAFLVLLWAWLSRTPLRALGYVPPKNWLLTMAGGLAAGIASGRQTVRS